MNTSTVMALSVFAVPVLAVAGLLCVARLPRLRVVGVAALAVAAALTTLALATYATFSSQLRHPIWVLGVSIGTPLATYAAVQLVAFNKYAFGVGQLMVGVVGGLLVLLYLGAHLWLVVGCSVAGECL